MDLKFNLIISIIACNTIIAYATGNTLTFAAETITWSQCLEETLKNNTELKSANEKLLSSEYALKGSYSGFFPKISTSLDYSYKVADTTTTTRSYTTTTKNYSLNLNASQNLFSGLYDKAKVDKANASLMNAKAEIISIKAKLSYDLKTTYAELLYYQRLLNLTDEIVRRRQDNLHLVELRFESGRENKGAVLLSKAYLKQSNYEKIIAKNRIYVAQNKLAEIIGREKFSDLVVTEDIPSIIPSITRPQFSELIFRTSEYMQATASIESADADIKIARSQFFPTIDLTGGIGRQDNRWYPEDDHWSVGVNFTLPLFSGGKDYYATRSAVENLVAATSEKKNNENLIMQKLNDAYASFLEAHEKLNVDESFLEASLIRAEIARNKYHNGLISFDDWDTIENDLISRQKNLLQSKKDRVVAAAKWEEAQAKGALE